MLGHAMGRGGGRRRRAEEGGWLRGRWLGRGGRSEWRRIRGRKEKIRGGWGEKRVIEEREVIGKMD